MATVVACFAVCFILFGCDKEVEDGNDDADGTPGSVVTIGANGNWFIDGDDTGVSARGSVVTIGEIIPSENGTFGYEILVYGSVLFHQFISQIWLCIRASEYFPAWLNRSQ